MALFAPWAANAQTTVTIGDGTATSNTNPIGTYYNYSITEQLYTADEIGMAGTITSVSFYYMGIAAKDLPITMYMANVDAADLSTGGISLADAEMVFSGTLPVTTTAGWVTINLDTPFAYDGTSSLLIGCIKDYLYYFSGQSWQGTATTTTMARYTQSDSAGPYTTSTVPSSTQANRPNIMLDITPGEGPICEKPYMLDVFEITATSCQLVWESSDYDNIINLRYKAANESEWTMVNGLTGNSYTLSGLTPNTNYSAGVQVVCDEETTSGWTSASFTTPDVCPDGKVCIGAGTATNSYLPTYTFYNYSLTQQIFTAEEIGEAGAILSVDFFKVGTNGGTRNLDIYMVSTDKSTFEGATDWITVTSSDLVFSGDVTFANDDWTTIEFADPFVYNGTSNVALIVDDNTGSYVNSPSFYVFDASNQAIRIYSDGTDYDPYAPTSYNGTVMSQKNRVRLAVGEPPACPKPTGVTVNYTGGTTAEVSWTGEAETYNLRVNATEILGVSNPYTLTNLELATNYAVSVQADCGDATSDWTNPVSFTTDLCLPEDMCEISIEMVDSYGDGWNGCGIAVVDALTNAVIGTWTLDSGSSAEATLAVCDGRTINFVWVSGSYASETSYTVYDINGEEIFSGSAGNGLAENYTVSCVVSPCRKPTDLAISEVGPRSAVLNWTENGEATAWQVEISEVGVEGTTVWNANEKPFTIVGLNPETNYSVRVLPDCEVEKWSDPITFTTTVACPAPTDLTATDLMPTSATLAWEGFGEGYEVEYAIASVEGIISIDFEDGTLGDWTVIDADGDGYNWNAWTSTEMVVGHNNSTYVVTSASYQGAALTPDNYLVSPQVQLGGTITFWACAQDASWPTEHFGVAVSTAGNTDAADFTTIWESDMTAKRVGTAQFKTKNVDGLFKDADRSGSRELGAWYEYTIDLSAYNGQTGYVAIRHFDCTDMFRLNVDDITIMEPGASEPTWIPVGEVTSPYTLNGLEPETRYNVRVRATCGEDGESAWVMTSFTTPGLCDLPSNLVVAENTTGNSVTLDWTGYQESYNIQYRHALAADPTTPATIILTVGDVWGDGSGYQMLLDADATAYGTIIPESGGLTTSGDAADSLYAEFEYKIPVNADGAMTTENIVLNNSITIEIPAGTYDWCITNPTPDDRIWIAASTGNVGGREDDYVFEAGVTYEFVISIHGSNDGVDVTITRPMSEWETVEGVTNPYTLTGLMPETEYEWQLQGVNADCGELEWVAGPSFTTPEVTTVTQTIALSAGWNWVSFYVEITLDDLKAAITEVVPTSDRPIIKSYKNGQTQKRANNNNWMGALTQLNLSEMYMIQVNSACEITLEGTLINPADYPATIEPGANWIAFPLSEGMTVTNAFSNFNPIVGDEVLSKGNGKTTRRGSNWMGALTNLVPGQGYIYNSKATENKTLVFPMPRK